MSNDQWCVWIITDDVLDAGCVPATRVESIDSDGVLTTQDGRYALHLWFASPYAAIQCAESIRDERCEWLREELARLERLSITAQDRPAVPSVQPDESQS